MGEIIKKMTLIFGTSRYYSYLCAAIDKSKAEDGIADNQD